MLFSRISILIVVALLTMAPAPWSSMADVSNLPTQIPGICSRSQHKPLLGQPPMQAALLFVQNEEKKLPEKDETGLSPGRKESGSEPKKKQEKKDLPTEPAPNKLKRFVPSEKIKADQAVDFPYDI
jgi:hypothetical protein